MKPQHRQNERSHAAFDHDDALDDHRVLSFAQWCQLCGISEATGRRLLAAGDGPTVTKLSPRRIGITVANNARWVASRSLSA